MFKNYFKTSIRNLLRNKLYSFINIAGLSIGLACAMLILLYIKDESSFDMFHENINNIYRIASQSKREGKIYRSGITGLLQGPRFAQNIPGIQSFVRVRSNVKDIKIKTEIQSQPVLQVDSSFFSIFTFPLLDGNAKTCLTEPHSIVLSEDASKKQFGTTDVVGKIVMIKEDSTLVPYKVTAVTKNIPQNSSIQSDMLLPFQESSEEARNNDNWYSFFLNTFVVLNEKSNLSTVENQMQKFYIKDASPTFKKLIEKYGSANDPQMGTYFLQPFAKMHMSTELPGLSNASSPIYSYILSGIALFILLIACINFINLTIARSLKRATEIGIRKVIGSSRKQLMVQFLAESFLLCFIAFGLALLIVQLILPLFNNLVNKALRLPYLFDAKLIVIYVLLFLTTGLLAGFYPALILSKYNPVKTLYSRFNISGNSFLQKSLVVLQFGLASFLIIATFVIYAQFNFLTNADLGYDDSNIVVINKSPLSHAEASAFKTDLLKSHNIIDVAPNNVGSSFTGARLSDGSDISFSYSTIDPSYIPELKIPLIQGRNFSENHPTDSNNNVLVNEAFVKKAGWKNPIGETVNFFYNNNKTYHVIGIVKDYHFASLKKEIGPQLFTMKNDNPYEMLYIRIKPNSAAQSLKYIQAEFTKFFPLSPYSYTFKDEQNRKNYQVEQKWKQILLFGTILTIFISCIGLFGLSVLSVEKRAKEIGIRKILGASANNIAVILSKDFLKLVVFALIIVIPAAWVLSNKWLENYPYRITIGWQMFAAASLLVILIAFGTVSFQTIKAALANPVKSLKTE